MGTVEYDAQTSYLQYSEKRGVCQNKNGNSKIAIETENVVHGTRIPSESERVRCNFFLLIQSHDLEHHTELAGRDCVREAENSLIFFRTLLNHVIKLADE